MIQTHTPTLGNGWLEMWQWIGYADGDVPYIYEMLDVIDAVYPGGVTQFYADFDATHAARVAHA